MTETEALIAKHQLLPHPEGGWYRRTFVSQDKVLFQGDSSRYGNEERAAGSSILYLLTENDFSAWHSVQSDETWYFHVGDSLLLLVINKEDASFEEVFLGPDVLQYTVRAGSLFCARSLGKYSLMGCAVTPGFDFKDFQLIHAKDFCQQYPQYQEYLQWIHPALRS